MDSRLEFTGAAQDALAEEFETYEQYLDSQISSNEMFYLEDIELARQLVELGLRGNGEIIRREEFEHRKKAMEQAKQARMNKKPKKLVSFGKDVSKHPLLLIYNKPQALQQREEAIRNGKLATIIFVRDRNAKGQEVSGYIDFGHRIRVEDCEPYFDRTKKFMPRSTDLSFYNWDTQVSVSNPTSNFQVIADSEQGLLFKNKRDRKVINVDPSAKPGDNTTRTELETDDYLQVVLYDHITRRRS